MTETIIFQGDSITDSGRNYDDPLSMGRGYPLLASARLLCDFPEKYNFLNRGISGNSIVDVYARMRVDIINLHPDCLSLMIGVNDILHGLDDNNGTTPHKFEKIYDMLIEELRTELPEMRIILMAPYLFKGNLSVNTDTQPDRYKVFKDGVNELAKITKEIARRYSLESINLQEKFDAKCQNNNDRHWSFDGVHPTIAGHQVIADEWIRYFLRTKK